MLCSTPLCLLSLLQALLIPIFAFSGRLIVSSFEFLPPHTPQTYPELGKAAAGAAGLRAVMLFSFLELFGGRSARTGVQASDNHLQCFSC